MKRILPLVILLFISVMLFSQISEEQRVGKQLSNLMKEGDDALQDQKFEKAKGIYYEVLLEKSDYCAPKRALSGIFFYESDYEKAAEILEEVIETCPNFSRVMYYEQGQFYYRIGDYDKAIFYFNKFRALQRFPPANFGVNGFAEDNFNQKYNRIVGESVFQAAYARDSIPAFEITDVQNLGKAINSDLNDYFPFMTNDGKTLLYTRMMSKNNEDFYVSFNKNGKWTEGKAVGNGFNTDVNEGMCTCTRDNVKMYFTACQRENVDGTCDIQQAILKITDTVEVLEVEPVKGKLNSEAWESQASISCDGRMMFFSSSRMGGFGKTDIYVSYLDPDGTWGKAENVGGNINTGDYEESPFITNDGKTLFFSSTGLLGMGEQDIYMSRLQSNGRWGKAVNLGNTVNTSARELGFFLTADGETGYFASDRKGGFGELDIYKFTLSKPVKSDPITFVEGFVKDSITLEPVETVLQTWDGYRIATDKNGRFFRCLPPGPFIFDIKEKGYLPYTGIEDIPEWHNRTFYKLDILLRKTGSKPNFKHQPEIPPKTQPQPKLEQPLTNVQRTLPSKPIGLSVYFDFDQYNIKGSEKEKLDDLLIRLRSNTYAKVSLKAYCDFKGTNEYNIHLSNNRAVAIFEYLVQNGIPKERIAYVGLGEVNDDNPRWMNRRVDISVN
ncbi:MAG: outer membrane protein OmpA-like peptidoglycan-associated protein [Maribacter sp.]|jgi:outer membrane protein OmpA-like peptidoglycan-associated protein/tetratricopeptide (TPR) repeat protein